jgi:hypothetical protein
MKKRIEGIVESTHVTGLVAVALLGICSACVPAVESAWSSSPVTMAAPPFVDQPEVPLSNVAPANSEYRFWSPHGANSGELAGAAHSWVLTSAV